MGSNVYQMRYKSLARLKTSDEILFVSKFRSTVILNTFKIFYRNYSEVKEGFVCSHHHVWSSAWCFPENFQASVSLITKCYWSIYNLYNSPILPFFSERSQAFSQLHTLIIKSNYSQVLILTWFWEHYHPDRANWHHHSPCSHRQSSVKTSDWLQMGKNGIKRESNFSISKISSVRCTGKVTTQVCSLNQVRCYYSMMNT